MLAVCILLSAMAGLLPYSSSEAPPIIGFDCNQTEPEILSISTLEIGPCPTPESLKPKTTTIYGQIIQRHYLDSIHIRTCQITKSTFYFKCGGSWMNYQVTPPTVGVIIPLTPAQCNNIHMTGIYKFSNHKEPASDLAPNTTYHFSSNVVGWTDKQGYCEGGNIDLNGQSYTGIVVQASYTVSIRESWGVVDHETGKINIESTLSCSYAQGHCKDAKTGTHSWTPIAQSCPEQQYKLLYQGKINLTSSDQTSRVLLSVNNPPFLFSAELGLKTYLCNLNLQMTEFPGILLAPQQNAMYQVNLPRPSPLDIKLITYLNAKITFTYHSIMDTAQNMYLAAIQETCHVEREMLKNRIEIIRLNSAAGGLSSLLQEGMFAKTNGEVIHLIKCEPSQVLFRPSPVCFDALPIAYKNTTMYLLPNTHIISPYANEIPCSSITPVTYQIGGQWWSYTGSFQRVEAPTILKPKTSVLPAFSRIRSFSQGGMYSKEDVEAVQKLLVFPSLREAITSKFADGIAHFSGTSVAMDLTSIMSEADWKTVAKRQLEQVWGYFSAVGNAISGLIGIYFLIKLIKCVFNSFLDAHELFQVFGCSLYLLGAFWGRLAQFLLNRTTRRGTHTPSPVPTSVDEEEATPTPTQTVIPLQGYRSPLLYPSAPEIGDTKV